MKTIRSPRDLAIHGAPPAYSAPLHVGRPNVGDRDAFLERVNQILDRNWLTNDGPQVRELESRIAQMSGVKHCVAMCNATIALEIAIRALGLSGEVIVPSYTFIATAHALQWQEIRPVFADIDPRTHNLDPAAVRRAITDRTTGIIGVHLWGRPAPVSELQDIAAGHGLKLMFDAAHAFGCSHVGRPIGGFGACEVFSFHATKFFNTFEGGAVVTDDDDLAVKMRLMRNFGFSGYDNVIHPGTNGKMTEISAAMGLVNLEAMAHVRNRNRANYDAYSDLLSPMESVSILHYDEQNTPNHQYVVVEIDAGFPVTRDDIIAALHAENILARRYFWPGCHRMKAYCNEDWQLPATEAVSDKVVVLPTGIDLPADCPATVASVMNILSTYA